MTKKKTTYKYPIIQGKTLISKVEVEFTIMPNINKKYLQQAEYWYNRGIYMSVFHIVTKRLK